LQALRLECAQAGDVFALAVCLYETLAGTPRGRIELGPQGYEAVLAHQLGRLDVSRGCRGEPVHALLRTMLPYNAAARPTAGSRSGMPGALAHRFIDFSSAPLAAVRDRGHVALAPLNHADRDDDLIGTTVTIHPP
jgi:hypothetical protein